jgi:hypothetical protein
MFWRGSVAVDLKKHLAEQSARQLTSTSKSDADGIACSPRITLLGDIQVFLLLITGCGKTANAHM